MVAVFNEERQVLRDRRLLPAHGGLARRRLPGEGDRHLPLARLAVLHPRRPVVRQPAVKIDAFEVRVEGDEVQVRVTPKPQPTAAGERADYWRTLLRARLDRRRLACSSEVTTIVVSR